MTRRIFFILFMGFLFGLIITVYLKQKNTPFNFGQLESANLPSHTNSPQDLSTVKLISPRIGDKIAGPLVIKGYVPKSWVFENQFRMKLIDSKEKVIIEDAVPTEWSWTDSDKDNLYFVESYNYKTTDSSGYLLLLNDNPSGFSENEKQLKIPIYFSPPLPDTVYLFLYDSEEDLKICDCTACQVVLPVPVQLPVTKTPIKDTLNLLAKRMHPDLFINSLNLKDGVLTIDFPNIPGFTSGGSCQQSINRLQVEKTALQFPEVSKIKISAEIFEP